MILHSVERSPFSSLSLQQCLKRLAKQDKLLLLGDAVIATSVNLSYQAQLTGLAKERRLFILEADLQARDLHAKCGEVIDYTGFVQLTVDCQSHMKW